VSLDNSFPYHVYGGLQDNSSWVGDSSYPGGLSNSRWENMYGGDGFWMFEDTSDPNYLYAEAQGGEIGRVNRVTHEGRNVKPQPEYNEKKLRFNWNTPIHMSPNEKGTLYIGAQFLFRSRDHGQSWERISPDLTTNDPEKQKQEESGGVTIDNSYAEMHTTIYSISESPVNGSIIWVGTDDGNLQITRDSGKTWTNVVSHVPGLGKNSWVSTVEASRFQEGTAYVTFDRHMFGDMKPYLYKTTDYGATWISLLSAESGIRGYAHVIKEDTEKPNLLFLGTEFGLWISLDGGKQWAQFKGGDFPSVAVRDISVHKRDSDVVLATHGRGMWVLDDISPLRALTPSLLSQEAAFVPARNPIQYLPAGGGWAEGDATFVGNSRTDAAFITYYQKKRHIFGDLRIEVFDDKGQLLNTVPASTRRGLNRAAWSMRLKPPRVPPAAGAAPGVGQGPRVLPGTYTVKMTKNDQAYTTKLTVVLDPRAKFTIDDRKQQFDLLMKLYSTMTRMSYAVDAILGVRNGAMARAEKLGAADPSSKRLQSLAEEVDKLRSKIVATKEGGAVTGEERLREHVGSIYGDVNSYEGRPTDHQAARATSLAHELEDVIHSFEELIGRELPEINKALAQKKLDPIRVPTQVEWEKSSGS
jgi:hypothetical protein